MIAPGNSSTGTGAEDEGADREAADARVVAAFYRTVSVAETAEEAGLSEAAVRRVLAARVPDHRVLTTVPSTRARRFDDDALRASLREAAQALEEDGGGGSGSSGPAHVSFAAYEAFVAAHPTLADGSDRPGGQVMHLRFGSWNAALAAAGLPVGGPGGASVQDGAGRPVRRGGRAKEFDADSVRAAVVACWRDSGAAPSASAYDAWQKARRREDPGVRLPSTATARKIAGQWSALLVDAWQDVHGIRLGK